MPVYARQYILLEMMHARQPWEVASHSSSSQTTTTDVTNRALPRPQI